MPVLREKDSKHSGLHCNIVLRQSFKKSDVFFRIVRSINRKAVLGGGITHYLRTGQGYLNVNIVFMGFQFGIFFFFWVCLRHVDQQVLSFQFGLADFQRVQVM